MSKVCISSVVFVFSLLFSGCSTVMNTEKVPDKQDNKKLSGYQAPFDKEVSYIYNGNLDVHYAKERVIWFAPHLTSNGDVVSEKTITVLPAHPVWTNEKIKSVPESISPDIEEFLRDGK